MDDSPTDEEHATTLQLGDLQEGDTLSVAEVRSFLSDAKKLYETQRLDDRARKLDQTLTYTEKVDTYEDGRGTLADLRSVVERIEGLHVFETAKILDLAPASVEEALELVPSLQAKIKDQFEYPLLRQQLQQAIDVVQHYVRVD